MTTDPEATEQATDHRPNRRGRWVTAGALAAVIAITGLGIPLSGMATAGDRASGLTVRKDVKDLTAQERRAFVDAVLKAKRTASPGNPGLSRYDEFVAWHRDAFRCEHAWLQDGNYAGAAHNSPTFLPWHRQYLHEYEQMLRDVSGNPAIALPYWDWTDPASTAAVFSADFMGGDGDPSRDHAVVDGAFRRGSWRIALQDPPSVLDGVNAPKPYLVRNFGAFLDDGIALPTAQDVATSLQVHRYDHAPYNADAPDARSFRNTLEGWEDATPGTCDDGWVNVTEEPGAPHAMHNAVHIYVGGIWEQGSSVSLGTMAYNTSPNDPVFFLHHANIDRIFAAWELQQGGHYRPRTGAEQGWNATDTMWPWRDRTINSWFGTLRNGYRYASLPIG